jgi:hypothetical protein
MGEPGTGAHFYICNFQKPPPGLMHVPLRKSLLKTVFKFLIISKIRLNIVRKKNQKNWLFGQITPHLKTAKKQNNGFQPAFKLCLALQYGGCDLCSNSNGKRGFFS